MADLTIQTRNAATGLAWVRSGLRLFARRPFILIVMVAFGFLVTWTVALLPFAGPGLALVVVPATSVGMLAVCRAVELEQAPGISNYTDLFRDPHARLQVLKIGIFYALVIGALGTAWSLLPDATQGSIPAPPAGTGSVDAGPSPVQQSPAASELPAITPARALLALASLAIVVPLEMSLWFAPVLCAWHRMSAGKALFYSFFACWRNRLAMLVYLLALLGIVLIGVMAFGTLISITNAREGLAMYLLAPLPLTLLAISKTCALAMYRDVVDAADLAQAEQESAI